MVIYILSKEYFGECVCRNTICISEDFEIIKKSISKNQKNMDSYLPLELYLSEWENGTLISENIINVPINSQNNEYTKIIFLDIDGFLNGYNKFTGFIYSILLKLHLIKFVRKHYDLFGIRTKMVKRLKNIIKHTNAKVVLSSSWRKFWYLDYDKKDERSKVLYDKFAKYNINVIDITPELNNRNDEILSYLNNHNDITNFVVIDDEISYFDDYIKAHLINTANTDYICGAWYENTGLKNKHVKNAIKILNKRRED